MDSCFARKAFPAMNSLVKSFIDFTWSLARSPRRKTPSKTKENTISFPLNFCLFNFLISHDTQIFFCGAIQNFNFLVVFLCTKREKKKTQQHQESSSQKRARLSDGYFTSLQKKSFLVWLNGIIDWLAGESFFFKWFTRTLWMSGSNIRQSKKLLSWNKKQGIK